jgi:hypothetical protein
MNKHWFWGAPLVFSLACGGESDDFGPAPKGGSAGQATGGTSGGSAGSKGGSAGSAGKAGGSIPLEDTPKAYATAYCSLLERCEGFLFELVTAYEDCVTLTEERLRQAGLDALTEAVDDGRVEYHGELMQACLDAVDMRACDTLTTRGIPECEAALRGTAAEGESCELNEECEGSLICETDGSCPGSCVDRYAAGEECAADDDCADGLVCSKLTLHCAKPAQAGEACEGGVEVQCDAGLFCGGADAAMMQPGVCAPFSSVALGGQGAACDPGGGSLCESGLSCVLVGLESDALVWECRTPAVPGGGCGIGLPEDCADGEYCPLAVLDVLAGTVTAKCTALPAAGEPCATRPLGALMPACSPYARCGGDGKCSDFRDLGESCTNDDVCYSGQCSGGACEPAHACE